MLRVTSFLPAVSLVIFLTLPLNADAQRGGVAATPSISIEATKVHVDDLITVDFEGANNAYDWIAIYRHNATPSRSAQAEDWLYVNGSRTASKGTTRGTVTFDDHDLDPGNYAIWFLSNDGYRPLADPVKLSLTASTPNRGGTPVRDRPDWEPEVLTYINEARTEARYCGDEYFAATGPVVWDEDLAVAARVHSNDMTTNVFRGHTGSDGSSAHERIRQQTTRFSYTGEVLSYFYSTPAAAVEGWLNSPGHCRILMGDVYTHMGGTTQSGPRFDNPDHEGVYRTAAFGGLPGGQANFNPDTYQPSHGQEQTTNTSLPSSRSPLQGASILVYGHDRCFNTTSLRRELDNDDVAYTLRDIEEESGYNREMWDKLRESRGSVGSIMLPVVEVDGTLVNGTTSINQLKEALEAAE